MTLAPVTLLDRRILVHLTLVKPQGEWILFESVYACCDLVRPVGHRRSFLNFSNWVVLEASRYISAY
jgi:hypothetical protein